MPASWLAQPPQATNELDGLVAYSGKAKDIEEIWGLAYDA